MKRTLLLMTLAACGSFALAQEDPDRRKNAMALFNDGLRAETQPPVNLPVAIQKYAKAIALAEKEGNKEVAAWATARAAICNEKLEPENISEALSKWKDCADKYGDDPKYGARAKEKAACKGVDLYLEKLHAQLDAWRVKPGRVPSELKEQKDAISEKIKASAPDKDAVPGLILGLGHRDEVIRDFAASYLCEVVDEAGITAVVEKLNDASATMRAGTSLAFQKIFKKYNEAQALFVRASNLDRDMNVDLSMSAKNPKFDPAAGVEKVKAEAEKMRKMARDILHNIPEKIGADSAIQTALAGIIGDDNAHQQARREAAGALNFIGNISGPLADALVKGMDAKDRNVREACVRAAGGVNTAISADKHKLADRLILVVKYEPAKPIGDDNKPPSGKDEDHPDWNNDEAVRQAACEALEQIALVKTLPSLIKALDDNDTRVRHAAFRALKEITGRDFVYENDDKGTPKTYEADRPLGERQKGKAKYDEWWKNTKGAVVLVERFWRWQSRSTDVNAVKLFDRDAFLKEVESRKWTSTNPKGDLDRATRIVDDFQKAKDVFAQDAEDLGGDALPNLIPFIGGETEKDPKGNAATRYFVAEACARIINKHAPAGGLEAVLEKLQSGDTPAKKAGAALALGFLGPDKVGNGREALASQGLSSGDDDVKEAAANALARVGNDGSASALTGAAVSATKVEVQLAALRALKNIHPKSDATVTALGELVADEPATPPGKKSTNAYIREYAVDALGAIKDSKAMNALLRACRDEMRNVREAAKAAVQSVASAEAGASKEICVSVLKDEKKKVDDRIGAALALGHMGDPSVCKDLAMRLRDPNPPRALKDQDPGVRIKVCEAFGNMGPKAKAKEAVEVLYAALEDDLETEAVRVAAYKALKAVFDVDPEAEGAAADIKALKFGYDSPKAIRDEAIKKWKGFIDSQLK
jgi:HEAT repeat protein